MKRKYVQVRPSRETLNPDDIVSHISSLHKLTDHSRRNSLSSRLNPLEDSSEKLPEFEFLAISQGEDAPVEFLYGTAEEHVNTLENRLTTAYPSSFDIEVVDIDVLEKIIPPERFAPDDFVKKLENGNLLFDPDAAGTESDIVGNHTDTTTAPDSDENTEPDSTNGTHNQANGDATQEQSSSNLHTEHSGSDSSPNDPPTETDGNGLSDLQSGDETRRDGGESSRGAEPTTNNGTANDDSLSLDVAQASDTTRKRSDVDAVDEDGDELRLSPEQIDGYDMLKELDAGLLDLVELPDEIDGEYLDHDIDGPTWTKDGDILARPTLEHGTPVAARWDGDGERKKDWMTTMKMFSKVAEPGDENIQDRAPLAPLIQHLARCDLPIAFQVVFKRIEDWSRQAERRKDNLHLNRDTLGQKVMYELGEILHGPSVERRRERMRDYMEDIGESADSNAESPITGDVGKRRKLIDNKIPKRTFRANIRAVSVANDEIELAEVQRTMDDLASVLDHLDGYFYGLDPTILRDGEGYRNKKQATEEFHRLVNRDIVSGSGKKRPDVVMNADELANFITVPSSENLTVQGVRGTRAEAESRDPLPKPDPDLMREFHKPGMRIGYAMDKESKTEPVPTQVPPGLLTQHYGRFATTGAGKSKALINDILSLYENTGGPTILVDPKGDGMPENYMRSHYERFGEEDFKENVIHFSVPDILPGFSFFNIESAIEHRYDENSPRSREDVRTDVIQNKADHYQELLKLVMGAESYGESKVAPILISSFIKILYDEEYVKDKQRNEPSDSDDPDLYDRESKNRFEHRHLEKLARQVKDGKTPRPVSRKNEPIQDTIQEQIEGDEHTFAVIMNSVFNRLNYIREDQHLRRMFNNTEPKFDFRDHIYDDKVIIFDLGDLRDEATMVMTGVILTELWDTVQSADQSVCTQNHASIDECRQKARENGLDTSSPPCREPWPDDHLVNLVIDEAASVTVSSIMTKMLEQGRSFHLSVGLSMQFPEQMKDASDRVYKNVLNNMATKLIGKITLDEEIAKAMAHEDMDVEDFNNRISALPRGEWIAQLPSPTFMETGPEPFSLQPLPIPSGHPESKHVLTEEAEQRFNHFLTNTVHRRTREQLGVIRESSDDGEEALGVDSSKLEGSDSSSDEEDEGDEDYADTAMGDVNVPDSVIGDEDEQSDESTPASGQDETDKSSGESGQENTGSTEENTGPSAGTTDSEDDNSGDSSGLGSITASEGNTDELPGHITWDTNSEIYICKVCGTEYYPGERSNAVQCCHDTVHELREEIGNPATLTSLADADGYRESLETYLVHDDTTTLHTVTKEENVTTDTDTGIESEDDTPIARPKEFVPDADDLSTTTIASIASTIIAETPPQYQAVGEALIEWYFNKLTEKYSDNQLPNDLSITEPGIREAIYETPPADIEVNTESSLNWMLNTAAVSQEDFTLWENNACHPAFKRFYSGRVPVSGTNLARPGRYGTTYGTTYGLSQPVNPSHRHPAAFPLPETDDSTNTEEASSADAEIPVEKVSASGLTEDHLNEHGISRDEANFMAAVVKAVNGDLEGYNLADSMSGEIKSLYDVNEAKLIENGYLERHSGVHNRVYYTVTPDGQDACGIKQEHGREIGDLGDRTPHRVGVSLTKQYYESLPQVQRVEISADEGRGELDLAVYDSNGHRIAIVEVEAGQTTADENDTAASAGINDYESIQKDYELLAESDGESVWVVRNYEIAASILQALQASDEIDLGIPDDVLRDLRKMKLPMDDLNENYLSSSDAPGVDKLLTYKQVRNKVESTADD